MAITTVQDIYDFQFFLKSEKISNIFFRNNREAIHPAVNINPYKKDKVRKETLKNVIGTKSSSKSAHTVSVPVKIFRKIVASF